MRLRTGILIDLGMLALIGVGGFLYLNLQAPKAPIPPVLTPSPTTKITPTTSLANPASVYCGKVGGTLVIKKRGDNGEYGLCQFEDNQACEEWALYRKDCPIGGRKTTGYDTIDQKYCAWLGGKTFAVPHATCTLPHGKICDDEALYNGTCTGS